MLYTLGDKVCEGMPWIIKSSTKLPWTSIDLVVSSHSDERCPTLVRDDFHCVLLIKEEP